MRNRVVEICEQAASLHVRHRQLCIQLADTAEHRIPLQEIAVLIVAHPRVTYTHSVLSQLVNNGGVFLSCDDKRMPNGMLLPLDAHSTQTSTFHQQFELPVPRQKRLWQQIVRSKIAMQGALLNDQTGSDHGLVQLIREVRSGDPSNVEARAARRYWTALFGKDFRRDRNASDANALLNYGYAVLRAATARAVCGAGLHPSVGLHHRNKYNSYCLADDVMEPFRPCVDRIVCRLTRGNREVPDMTADVRREILASLTGWVHVDELQRSLFDALACVSQSLSRALSDPEVNLVLPREIIHASE